MSTRTTEAKNTLDALPFTGETRILEPINPKLAPTQIECDLPHGYAVLVTPYDDGYDIQFENRPSMRHRFDDTDFHGDAERVKTLDDIIGLIKTFEANN